MLVEDLLEVLAQYNDGKGRVKKFFNSYSSQMDVLREFVAAELVGLTADTPVTVELATKVRDLINTQLPAKVLSSSDSVLTQPLSIRLLFDLREKCDALILEGESKNKLQARHERARAQTTHAITPVSQPIPIKAASRERMARREEVILHSCPVSFAHRAGEFMLETDASDVEKPTVSPK